MSAPKLTEAQREALRLAEKGWWTGRRTLNARTARLLCSHGLLVAGRSAGERRWAYEITDAGRAALRGAS